MRGGLVFIEIPGGGGVPQEGEGFQEGCLERIGEPWVFFFLSGRNVHQDKEVLANLLLNIHMSGSHMTSYPLEKGTEELLSCLAPS